MGFRVATYLELFQLYRKCLEIFLLTYNQDLESPIKGEEALSGCFLGIFMTGPDPL